MGGWGGWGAEGGAVFLSRAPVVVKGKPSLKENNLGHQKMAHCLPLGQLDAKDPCPTKLCCVVLGNTDTCYA